MTVKQGWGWGSFPFSALRTATSGAFARLSSTSGIGSAIGKESPSRNIIRSSSSATSQISVAIALSLGACIAFSSSTVSKYVS